MSSIWLLAEEAAEETVAVAVVLVATETQPLEKQQVGAVRLNPTYYWFLC